MSTFDGFLKEFPHLAIDYFRPRTASSPAVLVCLLSHIHSDHLQGLENKAFGGAFIYGTQATKELLLLTQERDLRVKFERKQIGAPLYKYGHLRVKHGRTQDLVRTLSTNATSLIRVAHEYVSVTPLDANHCPGAVMFLIEGSTKTVLYTGDMRAEPLFLASLLANPIMVPYVTGLRSIDCLYLDTSAKYDGPPYPSKSEGCKALVSGISKYPKSTKFYFNARCLGYEELWLAIARSFQSKIHVDQYRFDLFNSLKNTEYQFAHAMCAILTTDPNATRFHSCESTDPCSARSIHEEIYIKTVNHIYTSVQPVQGPSSGLSIGVTDFDGDVSVKSFEVDTGVILGQHSQDPTQDSIDINGMNLPKVLIVPFARHSSYPELVEFVKALRPKSVHSCTGDEGWRFNKFCAPGDQEPEKVRQHEKMAKSGRWHDSPGFKRRRLTEDIHL